MPAPQRPPIPGHSRWRPPGRGGLARRWAPPLLAAAGLLLNGPAARALETVKLNLPIIDTAFTVQLKELRSSGALLRGNSDLAELDRALGGKLAPRLVDLFDTPLPVQVLSNVMGTPLAVQVRLVLASFTLIDGSPTRRLNQQQLEEKVRQLISQGKPTILDLLQALPGRYAEIDLAQVSVFSKRLVNQRAQASKLVSDVKPASLGTDLARPGPATVRRSTPTLAVSHRPAPLELVLLQPAVAGNGRMVVISHGLWDSPENFEGWGRHLASHGYTVLLPRHPGSDSSQQEAMLSGEVPPPSPEELRLRPLDIKAVLDAVPKGGIAGVGGVASDRVVVIGHSWGATTAMQLGGAITESEKLREHCSSVVHPSRNLSWVLQCSFLSSADQSAVSDPRVVAVAAVSPPLSLLFDRESGQRMTARALLVSGSRDWVVPPDPEAIAPFARSGAVRLGHRLVLADGGDHFNMRAPQAGDGTPLRALLLAWVNGAFAAGPAARPAAGAADLLPAGGWGDGQIPLLDVSSRAKASGADL
ncbi:MAG: alpha/beta hydrolase family protein [Prochlorococcaceae cyanobacterium]